ncbi:MAG: GNAT family N-acetyltransferase [Negativicutes bacterium]|jgi:GNAT superfamily N-acetyltransferase
MFNFVKSSMTENGLYFSEYIESLSSIYCDFLEDHILASDIFSIFRNDKHIGYYGISDGKTLTQFYMPTREQRYSGHVFKEILEKHSVENALVPSCDELLLSLCMDNHKAVDLQSYEFTDSGVAVRPAEYPRELLNKATNSDLAEIIRIAGDFIDRYAERVANGELYILRDDGVFLGMGVIVKNRIIKNSWGTGMFVHPKHRQRGVGRSIILHLKDICKQAGVRLNSGCWYYNNNSKRTLESAGYVTKTRVLNVQFNDKGKNHE